MTIATAMTAIDEGRVAQRGLHLLAHQLLELEVMEQAQEHLVEPAGQLADAHHADVEGARRRSGAGAGSSRQLAPGVEALAHARATPRAASGCCADSCSPASARMIGMPALSSVCIWRQNSIRSTSSTSARRSSSAAAAPGVRRRRSAAASIVHRRDAGAEQLVGDRAAVAPSSDAVHELAARVARPGRRSAACLLLGLADAHRLARPSCGPRRQRRGMLHAACAPPICSRAALHEAGRVVVRWPPRPARGVISSIS